MANSTLNDKLLALAESVLDEVDGCPLDQRIEALKVIGALHLGLRKLDKGEPEDDKGTGIPAMRERLRAVENK